MSQPLLAVIGGSGLYDIEGLTDVDELSVDTPFGAPSDRIVRGKLGGAPIAFLPRHGRGHVISPTELNSRANIWALKSIGATHVVSVSACGSLRKRFHPRDVVVPDQLIDFTHLRRHNTFFGDGIVVHISLAEPFCAAFSGLVAEAVRATGGAAVHSGAAFITIEGPRFSTKAESAMFRAWGADIIGMTASPEAQLAREAEMCYAVMAHVTDYDVWHATEEAVTVDAVIANLQANTTVAKGAIRNLAAMLPSQSSCGCPTALQNAIITDAAHIPQARREELRLLIGKYLP